MSRQITLNSWYGSNPGLAAEKVARVFRINLGQASTVLKKLQDGGIWRFDRTISDDQAGPVAAYLQSLGFQVDLKPPASSVDEDPVDSSFSQEEGKMETVTEDSGISVPFVFRGAGLEFFNVWLSNWMKTIWTLGIYRFWAKTNMRRYICSNTMFEGDRFSYHGTGKELFLGFIKFFAMIVGFVVLTSMIQIYGGPMGEAFVNLVSILIVVLLPILTVKAWKYRLSRTDWRGIRFSFRGAGKKAMMIYLKGSILTTITLGLYWPYFRMEAEEFWRGNSYFGNLQGKFTGEGKEIFGKYLRAIFLTIITFGVYWIWFHAYLKRYFWSHTEISGFNFRFTARGRDWLGLYLKNGLLLLVTLGMAYPWVAVTNQKFWTDHLSLDGNINLDSIVQDIRKSSALGGEALDAFDIPIDIG